MGIYCSILIIQKFKFLQHSLLLCNHKGQFVFIKLQSSLLLVLLKPFQKQWVSRVTTKYFQTE